MNVVSDIKRVAGSSMESAVGEGAKAGGPVRSKSFVLVHIYDTYIPVLVQIVLRLSSQVFAANNIVGTKCKREEVGLH